MLIYGGELWNFCAAPQQLQQRFVTIIESTNLLF